MQRLPANGVKRKNFSMASTQLYRPTSTAHRLATCPAAFLQSSMSYGRNYSFEENAITKRGGYTFGCAAFEYGLWGIGFGRGPIGYEGSVNRFKFKAASYYSVYPLILSATHKACSFPRGLGLGRNLPTWLTQVDSVPRQAAFNVQVHTHRIIEWQRNWPNIDETMLRKEAT